MEPFDGKASPPHNRCARKQKCSHRQLDFKSRHVGLSHVTLTADTKKRVVIPGAVAGDVYACQKTEDGVILRRVYREPTKPAKKMTKAQVRMAIENWKFIPAMSWEELRQLTREP